MSIRMLQAGTPPRPRRATLAAATAAVAVLIGTGAPAAHARQANADTNGESFVVVKAGRIITGAGEEINDGEVVIVDGKVRLVGRNLEYPKTSKVIDAQNETVIPGLIHARARPDMPNFNRSGVRGNFSASSEVYLSRIDFEPFIRNGFTTVAIYPPGTQIPGVASVYHTAGPEEDQLLSVPGYVRMTMNSQPRDKGTLREAIKKSKAEIEKVEKAKKEWEAKKKEADAKKAAEAKTEPGKEPPSPEKPGPPAPTPPAPTPSPAPPPPGPTPPSPPPGPQPQGPPRPADTEFKAPEMDPTHRPIIDLLQKKAGAPALMMELGKSADYVHLTDLLEEEKEEKLLRRWYFLVGSPGFADFNYVTEQLGDAKATVALPPLMHRLPNTVTRFNLAGELIAAGSEVAFIPAGDASDDLESHRARVADLARSGIERAAAITAMTLAPAKLIGAEKQLGSIEKGKGADIVFLDGDILDPLARVTRVMINGEIVWKAEEGKQ